MDPTPETYAVIASVLGGGYIAVREIMRRISRDKVETAKDRAETNIIEVLQSQLSQALERADRAEKERNEAVAKIGELNGHIAALESRVQGLQDELERLRIDIKELRNDTNP